MDNKKFFTRLEQKSDEYIVECLRTDLGNYNKNGFEWAKERCDYISTHFSEAVIKLDNKLYDKYLRVSGKKDTAAMEEEKSIPYQVQLARKYNQLFLSSIKRNKEFNLSLKDVHELLQQKTCYLTGVPLTNNPGPRKRTVDRIDNSRGYVKGNVVACSHLANQVKNHLLEDQDSPHRMGLEQLSRLVTTLTNKINSSSEK